MDERRLTTRLINRWEASRKGKTLPYFEHFDNSEIQDVWPSCFIARIEDAKKNLIKCERVGEQIVSLCGRDVTGQYADQNSDKFPEAVIFNNLDEVRSAMAPIEGMGQFFGPDKLPVKWRACFLPFGDKQSQIASIMVGFSFKRG